MFGEIAPKLRSRGWQALIPIRPWAKSPIIHKWQRFNTSAPDECELLGWQKRYPDAGIGLAFGPDRVLAIDLDFLDPGKADQAKLIVCGTLGQTPLIRVGKPPKSLSFFRASDGLSVNGKAFGGFEVFSRSGQCVLFGIHPSTELPYQWPAERPETFGPADLPVVRQEQLDDFLTAMAPLREDIVTLRKRKVKGITQSGVWLSVFNSLPDPEAMITAGTAGIAAAGVGGRHPTMVAVVIALITRAVPSEQFIDALENAYFATLDASEMVKRQEDVVRAVRWAEARVWDGKVDIPLPKLRTVW